MRILILHGPNLNLLGRREPHIYGTTTLAQINAKLESLAKELNVKLEILQSNHEGELIDKLHQCLDTVQGAIINAAGLTHTSVSLHDAIKAMPCPTLEVHLSNVAAREPWRSHSAISPAVTGTIQGLGIHSYTAALRAIVEIVPELKKHSRASRS
jgi:3-dehydroquinate dehydratase-2